MKTDGKQTALLGGNDFAFVAKDHPVDSLKENRKKGKGKPAVCFITQRQRLA
ncbi:MAG: hypothetical protein AB7E34_00270 [Acidaminococcaceae bacterium]